MLIQFFNVPGPQFVVKVQFGVEPYISQFVLKFSSYYAPPPVGNKLAPNNLLLVGHHFTKCENHILHLIPMIFAVV